MNTSLSAQEHRKETATPMDFRIQEAICCQSRRVFFGNLLCTNPSRGRRIIFYTEDSRR